MRRKLTMALVAASLAVTVMACGKGAEKKVDVTYKAGTYTAEGTGNNGTVKVEVTFTEKEIKEIKVGDNKETPGICEKAFENVPKAIKEKQSLAVDTVSGATNSSKAVLTAVEECVKQAGVNPEDLKVKSEATGEVKVENETCDVVVVGAGASGTAAALSAAEQGANVIIIEKTATVSGAGTMAGCLFGNNSKQQQEAAKVVDTEWLYDQYIKDSLYYANARLVATIVNNSGKTVDWMINNGVNLQLLDAGCGAQYAHVGMPATGHYYQDGGKVAIETLLSKLEEKGGKIMYETTGTSLIKKDNVVSGVIAKKADGTEVHINASSVVLATGGFGGNEEMMKEYFGEKAGVGLISSATGDGIKMAWDAGAAEEGIDVAQWFGMKYGPEAKDMENSKELTELVRNPLLFVNKNGERFGNEEEAYESGALSTMIYNQPNGEMYIMVPQSIVDDVKKNGLADVFVDRWKHVYGQKLSFMEAGHLTDLDADTDALRTPKDFTATLEDAVKCGVATKGTVAEIAQTLNMSSLVEEVNHYNELCKAGKDTDFHKDAKFMDKIGENETVYAVKVVARCLTTLGGVKINDEIQAVDANNNAIANLFVAGSDAGGMYGNNYVVFEGGTLGFAYTSGRLAGESAAKNVTKNK